MKHGTALGDDQLIRRRPDIIAVEADGGMVVLDADRGDFLQLSSSAASIWKQLDVPTTIADICHSVSATFAVDAAVCRVDVKEFVGVLAGRNMIETIPTQ